MPKANVLLSWSKDRSRAIAEAFRDWLPDVVHGVNVWMSSSDLEKGSPWLRELTDQLASSAVGVVFVTPENQHEPWLIYEAGVISRAVPERRCCPILFGLRPTDVTGPLGQFQATIWEKADLLLLVKAINAKAGEDAEGGGPHRPCGCLAVNAAPSGRWAVCQPMPGSPRSAAP